MVDHQPIQLFAFKKNGERNAFPMHKQGYPFTEAFGEGGGGLSTTALSLTYFHPGSDPLTPLWIRSHPGFDPTLGSKFADSHNQESVPLDACRHPPECRHMIISVEIKRRSECGLL